MQNVCLGAIHSSICRHSPCLFTSRDRLGKVACHIFLRTASFVYISEVKVRLVATLSAEISSSAMFVYIT